jgi:uncharacterized membrane protein
MLHLVKKWDRWFLWINTGFLMSVTFIPVPLAILANYRVPLAVLIYGFALIVSSVWLLAIWEYMARHPELLWDDVNQGLFKPVRRQILWAPGVYGVATVLAGLMHWFERDGFWVPLIPIALLQSWYMLPGNIDRDAKARTVAPAAVSGE